MKKKIKKILPIIFCFVMVLGSCLSVNAAKITSEKYLSGSSAEFYASVKKNVDDTTLGLKGRFLINEAEDEVRCFAVGGNFSDSVGVAYVYLVSKMPFNLSLRYISSANCSLDCSDVVLANGYSNNGAASSFVYNGTTYYYIEFSASTGGCDGQGVSLGLSNMPFIHFNSEVNGYTNGDSQRGKLFEKAYLADFTWDDSLGPTEPNLDNASMNTSLGYLSNISYASYIQKNSDGYPIDAKYVIGWDNNHSDWDDSYRVAHYIKVRADIKSLGNSTKSMYSDMIFVDDVPFSNVKSSFLNSDMTSSDTYNSFISDVEEQSNILTDFPYTTGYIHYLIIYHETDNGIQYGYWNQITSDDFENSSIGKVPGYGIIDSDGNYVEIQDFGRLEDYEIGVGDSIEDAENNKETVTPNFDVLPSIKNIDDFMQYFQEMMASLFETIGSLPKYVAEFFSFLPSPIIVCLTMGVLIAIILRIVGR